MRSRLPLFRRIDVMRGKWSNYSVVVTSWVPIESKIMARTTGHCLRMSRGRCRSSKDGLVHISQLAPRRVQKVTDVVEEGDKVKVKLLGFDDRGKGRLSMKVVDQQTGEDLEARQKAEAERAREAAGAGAGE